MEEVSEGYRAKAGRDTPFERRRFMGVKEAKSLDSKGLEAALRRGTSFSKGAARLLVSTLISEDTPDDVQEEPCTVGEGTFEPHPCPLCQGNLYIEGTDRGSYHGHEEEWPCPQCGVVLKFETEITIYIEPA